MFSLVCDALLLAVMIFIVQLRLVILVFHGHFTVFFWTVHLLLI